MIFRVFLYLMGFGLSVSGGVTMIAYLNFLPGGISWWDYFLFVSTRFECYLFPIGILLITFSIYTFPEDNY